MTRPTILERELIDRVADHVAHGAMPLHAAQAEGVPESTWYLWLAKGRRDLEGPDEPGTEMALTDPIYVELVEAIDTARAQFRTTMPRVAVARARTTADALAILERHPDTKDAWRVARTNDVHHSGEVGVTVRQPEVEADLRERLTRVLEFVMDAPPITEEVPDASNTDDAARSAQA